VVRRKGLQFLGDPVVPYQPADKGSEAAPPDNGDRADPLLEDADEADDEDNDRADVLDDDGSVGD